MIFSDPQFVFTLIYFFYGLAFFSLGLTTFLESYRFPLLIEAHLLRTLAVFGFLHGSHEWLELLMMGSGYIATAPWVRLGLLALSFCALIAFSIQLFRPPKRLAAVDIFIGAGFLALYVGILLFLRAAVYFETPRFEEVADALARYFLAIPGSILASIALWRQGRDMRQNQREALARYFHWTALGFLLYGITQVFTPPADIFPANVLNSAAFLSTTGIPIQALRVLFAIFITVSLIQLIKAAEQERQAELRESSASPAGGIKTCAGGNNKKGTDPQGSSAPHGAEPGGR